MHLHKNEEFGGRVLDLKSRDCWSETLCCILWLVLVQPRKFLDMTDILLTGQ